MRWIIKEWNEVEWDMVCVCVRYSCQYYTIRNTYRTVRIISYRVQKMCVLGIVVNIVRYMIRIVSCTKNFVS